MKCNGCPFNDGWTEEATKIQDLGCLASKEEIIELKDTNNENWLCHNSKTKICGGLAEVRDISTGVKLPLRDYLDRCAVNLMEKI